MKNNRLIFALFAAAILFSIMHEWTLPVACIRPLLAHSTAAKPFAH
jgi:hypothetical protein